MYIFVSKIWREEKEKNEKERIEKDFWDSCLMFSCEEKRETETERQQLGCISDGRLIDIHPELTCVNDYIRCSYLEHSTWWIRATYCQNSEISLRLTRRARSLLWLCICQHPPQSHFWSRALQSTSDHLCQQSTVIFKHQIITNLPLFKISIFIKDSNFNEFIWKCSTIFYRIITFSQF